jgi:hypothetical protein
MAKQNQISNESVSAIAADLEATLTVVRDLVALASKSENSGKSDTGSLLTATERYLDDLLDVHERLLNLCAEGGK